MHRTFLSIASALLFTAASSQARSVRGADDATASIKDGRTVLRQMEVTISRAALLADELERANKYTRVSRETDMDDLNQIGQDINRAGREVGYLESKKETLAPWEREAVEKSVQLLKDAANNTDQAVIFLKETTTPVWAAGAYQRYTEKIDQDCAEAAKLLRSYLKLDRTTEREKQLRESLGLPSGS